MKSVWSESCNFKKRESLNGNIEAEAVVIGAGIAGLLTAYLLKKKGINVVVIEAEEICSGNTKNTTAKITSQHALIYDKLIKEFGEDKARQYANANKLAIEKYREIIDEEKIKCDFEEKDAYLYTLDNVQALENELKAATKLGIKAKLLENTELPFKVKAALKFYKQGQFNPLKFLEAISKDLTIYENTRALEIKEDLVVTDKGIIASKAIVVATHYPIMNTPGYYFLRMHQERSYVIALENAQDVNGMYIGIDNWNYSFRNYKDLLLLGGGSHRTGKNESGGKYEELRRVARKLYPDAIEKYHWSAQDCVPVDEIPYIGQYSTETPNLYVATGFKKWGMTSSMVAAMILSDMISGNKNDFSEIFSPTRFDMSASSKNLTQDVAETAKNFIAQRIHIPSAHVENVEVGHGGIIEYKGEKVGVYKESKENIYTVTTKCPHLGCELQWNPDELSWDCPCHGSRFDYKGNWIESPAIRGLYDE
ncbi:MAG: FAD-dependent oxidoreductase [Clostridium sp.]